MVKQGGVLISLGAARVSNICKEKDNSLYPESWHYNISTAGFSALGAQLRHKPDLYIKLSQSRPQLLHRSCTGFLMPSYLLNQEFLCFRLNYLFLNS